jgi:hypothetical protein
MFADWETGLPMLPCLESVRHNGFELVQSPTVTLIHSGSHTQVSANDAYSSKKGKFTIGMPRKVVAWSLPDSTYWTSPRRTRVSFVHYRLP